jgi:hypothetical protein
MDDATYSSLMDALGEEGLDRAIGEADALAFVDWTMVPGFTGILRGILDCILPRISPKDRLVFFDLADLTKRDPNELRTTPEKLFRATLDSDVSAYCLRKRYVGAS